MLKQAENASANAEIANLLYPDIPLTVSDIESRYPKRKLNPNASVTRFAPSPTGFVHIGGIYNAFLCERLAHQSGGIFILRVEDTDAGREVEGGTEAIAHALLDFGFITDEGVTVGGFDKGDYGPYLQSKRKKIYAAYAKRLVAAGLAYPSFKTPEELELIRQNQEQSHVPPGYYGLYADDRELPAYEVRARLQHGERFVVRIKAMAQPDEKIILDDLIRGSIILPKNSQDYVLIKSDGLPTYHFASVVDDHLMGVTDVIRGEEWIATAPVHIALNEAFGWIPPRFAHMSPILKVDANTRTKRKISKRKDPEAWVGYYLEEGYDPNAVLRYLLTIANSNFDDWSRSHPGESIEGFFVDINRMNNSGAVFDIDRLNDISQDVFARYTAEEVYQLSLQWANQFDEGSVHNLADILKKYPEYAIRVFSIERNTSGNNRKDLYKLSQIREQFGFFFDELFNELQKNDLLILDTMSIEDQKAILSAYLRDISTANGREDWFESLKELGTSLGFVDTKTFKKSIPGTYKGSIGDVAMVLRVALTNRTRTPDLFEMIEVMGKGRVKQRLRTYIKRLK